MLSGVSQPHQSLSVLPLQVVSFLVRAIEGGAERIQFVRARTPFADNYPFSLLPGVRHPFHSLPPSPFHSPPPSTPTLDSISFSFSRPETFHLSLFPAPEAGFIAATKMSGAAGDLIY